MKKALLASVTALVALAGFSGAADAASGPQKFQLVFTGTFTPGASNTGTAVASGTIRGVGQGINSGFLVNPDGTFAGSNKLVFSQGTIFIGFTGHLTSSSFDFRTCLTKITGVGNFTVTGGDGAFTGTTGSGTFSNKVDLVGSQGAGNCSGPTTEISQITLTGNVSVP